MKQEIIALTMTCAISALSTAAMFYAYDYGVQKVISLQMEERR